MWSQVALFLLLLLQSPDFSAEGIKALEAQKYNEAAQLFAKAVEADPKDYAAHFHLALAESLLGKDAEAVASYKKVLELKPGLYEAELNLGIVLLRQKQARDAVPYLESAAQKKLKESRPRLYLAQALFEAGDFPRAEQSYQAAAELDPKSAAAQLGLAQALARQNRLKEAEPYFRKAAELDPGFKDDLLQLASLYEKSGQAAEAIAIYQQFLENAGARERLGDLMVQAGRPAEAVPHLEWAVQKSPTTANRVALALAYRRNKQPEKELPLLEQAVQADPANLDLRMIYGRTLRDQKDYSAAARQFYQVAQAKPDSVEAFNELAAMLISLENYPQALAALDRIKALGGETAGHHYLRAIVLDKTKDLKGALASYQQFLAMSQGKHPDEEFKARQRMRIIQKELAKR
jgi:tetratricopeptide (TPR) repeat protein